jgi:hypothetical protein
MLSVRRWSVVAGGVAVLVALPTVIGALPVRQSSITAADLLSRIRHSTGAAYSGYAESYGGLALPVTRQFNEVADLFGQTTQMRVWYRGRTDWRVDTIAASGESGLHANRAGTWTWDYESNTATWTGGLLDPAVRLPTAGDLLPTNLARRLLSEATPDQVRRLPAKRIVGRSVPGLRLTPHERGSTIEHVDVWADEGTGLPLRVDVFGSGTTVMSTRFLDFSTHEPSARDTRFTPPAGARLETQRQPDVAAELNQFGDMTAPSALAGVPRNPQLPAFGSIGIYGSGVTEFAAAPVPGRIAFSLRYQLESSAAKTKYGLALAIGPLSMLLTKFDLIGNAWLLTGTVTQATLARAAAQLLGAR